MQIGLIRVDQTALNEMPEAERRAFFAFGFLANEIICLQRLSYWCVVETACSSDIEYEARTSQVFFLMRIKIGKLKEANNSLKKFYFDSCLSKKYDDKLDPAAREALKTFKRELDRNSHAFNEIRSKISFHADCDSLYANAVVRIPHGADLRIYADKRRTNWLWQYAEIGVICLLAEVAGKSERDILHFCIEESGRLSSMLLLFLENWISLILQEYFPSSIEEMEHVELSGLAPHDAVAIPFFTEDPQDEAGSALMPITVRFPLSAGWSEGQAGHTGE